VPKIQSSGACFCSTAFFSADGSLNLPATYDAQIEISAARAWHGHCRWFRYHDTP
jgi:hypothetical protein